MTRAFIKHIPSTLLWSAVATTTTTEIHGSDDCSVIKLEVVTVGFSGTIDIQGRYSDGSYHNIPFSIAGDITTVGAPSISQLSYTTETASTRFLVFNQGEYVQLVMTRSAGSITARAIGLGESELAVLASTGSIPAGEAHLGEVGGLEVNINASVTRPADTTAYAAGDAITNSTSAPVVITFTNAARKVAGSGIILGAILIDSAYVAALGVFELWLFDTTVTPDNDNAVFTPTDAELATLVGIIPFNTAYIGDVTAGVGGNVAFPVTGMSIPFVTGAASRDLFGLLVVRTAYVPISGEIFVIRLRISQD